MSQDASMSQTDVVVYGIKQMILDGRLAPGSQLPIEKDLAVDLAVSRSSLREGVRALVIMGVLETRQGAGTFVTSLDASLLLAPMEFVVDLQHGSGGESLHSVRRVLEMEAAEQAALNITAVELEAAENLLDRFQSALESDAVDHELIMGWDIEFHQVVARASGNGVLAALIEALASRTVRGRIWRAIADEGAEHTTLREHREVLRALVERSPSRARLRMGNHLLAVEDFLREHPPEY